MAIELHHLQPSHDDELSRLKARIADLEALNHDLCERVTDNDKNYYRLKDNIDWIGDKKYDRIIYRTWWMVAVNLLLKILQSFTHDPFLVNVESKIDDEGNPHFIRYCFRRSHYDDRYFERIKSSFLTERYIERFYE